MTIDFSRLAEFGWSNHFQSQLTSAEIGSAEAVRVLAVHRNGLDVGGPGFAGRITVPPAPNGEEPATVGDWLLVEPGTGRPIRVLDRKSLFRRRAAGTGRGVQPIAANVDTLLVVTSCNHDFNPARLERYLALARESEVTPVVVLTKADLADDPGPYVAAARRLMAGLLVETMDARDPAAASVLDPWCGPGQTVALVGSSGVGKSTLVNTLLLAAAQATAPIREDDSRGRHTTTGRSMHRLAAGGWLIDTPGMRELQLTDVAGGLDRVFDDVVALAAGCRFADCRHESEPGCAVRAAVAAGTLDDARVRRYGKLVAEEARNAEAIHERRSRERRFGKMVKSIGKARDKRGPA